MWLGMQVPIYQEGALERTKVNKVNSIELDPVMLGIASVWWPSYYTVKGYNHLEKAQSICHKEPILTPIADQYFCKLK